MTGSFLSRSAVLKPGRRVKFGLEYFLDHFLDHFFGPLFGPFIGGGSTLLVFREGWMQSISTEGGVGGIVLSLRER